jgi:uncharacterized protein
MFQELSGDRRFKALVLVVLALASVGIVAYTYLAYTQARYMVGNQSSISVSGKSERFVRPDVATFTFSVMAEEKDAVSAQNKSAEASNNIIAFLKEKGIEEKDIKTVNYSLSPKYEYIDAVCNSFGYCPPGKQNLVGYTVDQTVSVKVRKVDTAGDLISGVGGKGATNVSGLTFTVDDPDVVREEVRAEAIKDAKEKAERLADNLGVRLGRLISYYEDSNSPMPYANGYGGAMMEKSMDASMAPMLTPGENEIISTVNLIYEIR